MEHKIKQFRKTVFISFILFVQVVLIYAYYTQQDFINNFKSDYLSQVYFPAYRYELEKNPYLKNPGSINQSLAAGPNIKAIPVLLYHGIVEREDGSNILVDDFRNQMFALKNAGYQTVTLNDFYQFAQGKKELPDKSFLLTFDDGRKDSYYPADPILSALDYNAVMFVITRYINAKNENFYLHKAELQKMLDSKHWELEAHTKEGHDMVTISADDQKGHYYTNKLWNNDSGLESDRAYDDRVFNDIVEARNDLENNFGIKPLAFAFPFGDFGLSSVNYPQSKDKILDITHYTYPISFYQITLGNGYLYNYFGENDYLFKRINVDPEWSANDLMAILKAGQPKELPFEDDFTNYKGWFASSGSYEMHDNSLLLRPSLDSTSANLFLDGSKLWKNYTFHTVVDWNKGSKLSLFSHYKDISNYLSCEISDQYVQLISEFGGNNQLLSEIQIDPNFPKINLPVDMKVEGDKVECTVNNATVTFTGVSNEQGYGGVGMRISDNQMGNGELVVKKITVADTIDNLIKKTVDSQELLNPLGLPDIFPYNKQ